MRRKTRMGRKMRPTNRRQEVNPGQTMPKAPPIQGLQPHRHLAVAMVEEMRALEVVATKEVEIKAVVTRVVKVKVGMEAKAEAHPPKEAELALMPAPTRHHPLHRLTAQT